ncbi:GNAT family N-acetyltransferase [Streptococcus massiliensis]|uniref:Acetyltransferase n=1 Tax=Streptococcus massiliensis TaxID=313439 RepID=A0A380KWB6_9STRE|nr:GNAT family N-acetyltransferase [Streptococcus massiliensis]SUN75841.1 acetyltransferase [Streptococcus massiliensis]
MIDYTNQKKITAQQFAHVLEQSGIHRPTKDLSRLQKMLDEADILWTAWDGERLVGVARSLTDFSYACYLSDLAVDESYQKQGIGKILVEKTRQQIGEEVALILLSAPNAMDYYPKIGFETVDNAFIIKRKPF